MSGPDVTVIIPTIGDDRRGQTIWRAIASAGPRSGVSTRILVVINGKRFSETLLARLRATPAIECAYVEHGLPVARHHGRAMVTSEFFSFLDDDDEFLENGLRMRLDVLRQEPAAAFVVANGTMGPGGDEPVVRLTAHAIEADPYGTLLVQNWLASASGLYRTSAVSAVDIAAMPEHMEWTYLGFRLASRPFRFLDRPTYRLYDLPGSVSKSQAYRTGTVATLRYILDLDLPRTVRARLRQKLGAAHHALSSSFLEERSLAKAWKHHCLSLACPGGWRYATYTRRLVLPPMPPGTRE